LFFASSLAFTDRFDGHKVYRIVPRNSDELSSIKSIEQLPHNPSEMNWWLAPSHVGAPADIRVAPTFQTKVLDYLHSRGLDVKLHIGDAQQHLEEARRVGDGTWDTEYHPYDAPGGILDWMKSAASANPSFVSLFTLGNTFQNRTVYGLRITKDTTGSAPAIYIDGAIHAREWLTPATMCYVIGQFVNHTSDSTVANYISKFAWYIIPVWNADGYNYTWTTNPEWRKNRQTNSGSACVGTDCNRNCETGWSNVGASSDPCSDEYHGTAPWSAPETAIWRDYLTKLVGSTKVIAYVNFHSNAEMWLDPYGYTARLPPDYDAQEANAKNVTTAIKAVHGETYVYGPVYTTIYPASGGTLDWTYESLKIKLSQACELRGNSFQPSPTLIVPVGQEILAGLYKLADDGLANA